MKSYDDLDAGSRERREAFESPRAACVYGPGKFCLVHWKFCAALASPHARPPRPSPWPRDRRAATAAACDRIRKARPL